MSRITPNPLAQWCTWVELLNGPSIEFEKEADQHMAYFKASVQYGDWHGTAAGDEYGDNERFDELFATTGKVDPAKEIMIAFSIYAGDGNFFVLTGYFHKSPVNSGSGLFPTLNEKFEDEPHIPIKVKAVRVEITVQEFFKYFKRFNVVLARAALDIAGREYIASGDE